MSDLIERARVAQYSILPQPEIIKELADEVERLRGATSLHHELVATLEAQLAAAREALRISLTAMKLASGFEVISIEFEFRHAIDAVKAALGKDTRQ